MAGWLAFRAAGPAVADHLATGATDPAQLERALAWDPRNANLHLRLAATYEARLEPGDQARTREHLVAALRLRPTHAGTWLALAQLADREGDRARAQQTLDTAVRLDRDNVGLRWEAALLALRWGEREAALDHLRYVLAVDPAHRDPAFQLAQALLAPGETVASLLPAEQEAIEGILQLALGRRDLALARAAWERRTALPAPVADGLARHYLSVLLEHGEGALARTVWDRLVRADRAAEAGNLAWNGDFERDRLLGWGFDWQVRRVWGVEVGLDRAVAARGRQSLRLAFNSFPTLDYAGVFENVAVEPGREYRLRARVKALDFVTRSGLQLEVVEPAGERVLAATAAVSGTTPDWTPVETRVRVPAETTLVRIRLHREKAPGPEGNLGGKVWIDDVSLTPDADG